MIDLALLAPRANRAEALNEKGSTTSDADVVGRRWFAIDLDGGAVAGVSTTDAEHEAALERGRLLRDHLSSIGWPAAVLADSGNGAHLLYRVDLPKDVGDLAKQCLEALQEQFGGDGVTVDRTVHNPSRIWKLYGTLARKGDNRPDRPHRLARLLEVPQEIVPVSRGLLEALAATAPKPIARKKTSGAKKAAAQQSSLDLAAWISEHGLDVEGPEPWQDGELWTFAVCLWNSDHQNRSAWVAQLPRVLCLQAVITMAARPTAGRSSKRSSRRTTRALRTARTLAPKVRSGAHRRREFLGSSGVRGPNSGRPLGARRTPR